MRTEERTLGACYCDVTALPLAHTGLDLPWRAGQHSGGWWYVKALAGTEYEYTMIRACLTEEQAAMIEAASRAAEGKR